MANSFSKGSMEQIIGGNGGVFVADYITGYINGKLNVTGTKQAIVATIVKALGGAAVMAAGDYTERRWNNDAGQVVIGAGSGPIMTIANDWYKAIYGMDVGTAGQLRAGGARAKTAAPRARTIRAPAGAPSSAASAWPEAGPPPSTSSSPPPASPTTTSS